MGDSGKLRFYELDHDESKMRLLKTQSHTSDRLAMKPGTRETLLSSIPPEPRIASEIVPPIYFLIFPNI